MAPLIEKRILLENYYLPGDLERAVADFVDHYNHRRYHESLDNLTPAGRLPRARPAHHRDAKGDQAEDHRATPQTSLQSSSLSRNQMGRTVSSIRRSNVRKL